MMLCARHRDFSTTERYIEGYQAVLNIFQQKGVVTENVPKFSSVHVKNSEIVRDTISTYCKYTKSLTEFYTNFVEELCGF